LRAEFPNLKIVAAILSEGDSEQLRRRQPSIPADELATSLREAATQIVCLRSTSAAPAEQTAFSS
jgi:hypothetical protein